jgi:transposase
MNLNATTLPDSPAELKGIVGDLHQENINLRARHDKETGILLEQISLLRAQLYGRKSEKIIPGDGPKPLPLFDMPEPAGSDEDDDDKSTIHVPAHDRKKRGRKPLPEDLPRVKVVHDISDADKVCACGSDKDLIGEERAEKLDIIPARAQVIVHIRLKYACKNCEGVQDDGATITIAPVPAQIIPKSIAGPGLLAHIITAKFTDHLPFYRQEKQFARMGVEVSRTSMCNWAMKAAEACQPLLNLLQDEVLEGKFINIDETTLQVLHEPGRSPTSKSYMWIFRRGDPKKPILIYKYHPSRAGSVAMNFLGKDFQGYIQTDGYSGYNFLDDMADVVHIGCWAHARRKFTDVLKSLGKKPKNSSADNALKYIKKLYKLEREACKDKWSCSEIYNMRQEKAKPILADFKKWLSKEILLTPQKGLLGKAIAYALNQWQRLAGYIKDGSLTIDNNMAENSIRPFVIGRKNWLFSGTPKGAEASALLYSLVETAKANKLEPYAYLRHIFDKLPTASSLKDYEMLLPWNLTREHMASARLIECG